MSNELIKEKIELLIIFFFLWIMTWALSVENIGIVAMVVCLTILFIYIFIKIYKNYSLNSIVLIPIMLSIFQNIYLGINSVYLSSRYIQLLTVINFIIACFIFVIALVVGKGKENTDKNAIALLAYIFVYSIFSVIFLNKINVISVISSLRNIISVFIFYMIGNLLVKRIDIKKIEKIILFFAIITILFGIYEKFFNIDVWKSLNITELWNKKGINVQDSGLPTNFYSSETINGSRIRRMTATFADPVNLGTFLFSVFCISWINKKYKIMILTLFAIALTVSKGAFLGVLIFLCIYFYNNNRRIFGIILIISTIFMVSFLVYAFKTSANSVFLHISGFVASLRSLVKEPLGHGIGSVGVISKQFSGFSSNAQITETGMGMIIGQLGIIGLLIYCLFFISILKKCLKVEDVNIRIYCTTLLLSIIANIIFNEVALSPNSCAIYFLLIGYYLTNVERKQNEE